MDQDYGLSDFFKRVDSLFLGRKSYEMILSMGDQAGAGFPKFKEYVFSTTLNKVKDGAILIKADIKNQVEMIKKEKGKDIWLYRFKTYKVCGTALPGCRPYRFFTPL